VRRIVVTGIGMINAVGNDKESSFKAICDGVGGIGPITLFDTEKFTVKIAGEVKDFDPATVMEPKEVKKADRFIQLGLKAAQEAMADANFGDADIDMERFGIAAGSGIGGLPSIEKNSIILNERGPRRISPFFIPGALVNMLGGFVTIDHNLKGPNLSAVTACAAGTHSISEAAKTIMCNGAERMLVVAAESAITGVGIGGFASMKALSTTEDATVASRPFDAERNGFVMGEGAGALVLEEYDVAVARGANIYAELIGFGESGDANHITTPSLDGPLRAMKAAFKMAGEPKIDYVNAHGTSTPVNDKNETAALKELFGGKENCPPVSSTKGQTGHCLGAAGGLEAIISIMAMRDGIIPPTINHKTPDENCDLDIVPNEARKAELNCVMSNSFGFGGTNGVVIFKKI